MSRIFVAGLGAVSPAGWGVPALCEGLDRQTPLPVQKLERSGAGRSFAIRPVPPPPERPAFLGHPRLRRASPLTHFAAGAALEAISALPEGRRAAPLGLIFCLHSGPVQYASRFFEEALKDPSTASPLLFPETVFAAPASHIAALLGNTPLVYTLTADPGGFLQGLALAADWLLAGRVENCLVLGAEEFNWFHAQGVWLFDHRAVLSPGAGAVCVTRDAGSSIGVELEAITDAQTYSRANSPRQAITAMRRQLPKGASGEVLCLGAALSQAKLQREVWSDWPGTVLDLAHLFGEGFMATAAWQCVLAAQRVAQGRHSAAHVSIAGCNQQAIGARFVRSRL